MAGPLEGIRVADFTWVWAGPTCTMQLAHMGAEVIRMESMRRVCTLRMLPPWPNGQPGVNRSGYFNQYNQGKRSIQLDISQPEGADLAKQIVATSDVAVENFASNVIDRLGLGYEEMRKVKPDLIMMSMSGYGRGGPESDATRPGSFLPSKVACMCVSQMTFRKPSRSLQGSVRQHRFFLADHDRVVGVRCQS